MWVCAEGMGLLLLAGVLSWSWYTRYVVTFLAKLCELVSLLLVSLFDSCFFPLAAFLDVALAIICFFGTLAFIAYGQICHSMNFICLILALVHLGREQYCVRPSRNFWHGMGDGRRHLPRWAFR
jgi:hypothetical protein